MQYIKSEVMQAGKADILDLSSWVMSLRVSGKKTGVPGSILNLWGKRIGLTGATEPQTSLGFPW